MSGVANPWSSRLWQGLGGDRSTRYGQVNRLLPPEPRVEPRDPAFLLQLGSQRRGGSSGPRGKLFDLLIDIFGRDRNVFAAGDFIQRQRAGHGSPGRLPLSFPELRPVNPRLRRVDGPR